MPSNDCSRFGDRAFSFARYSPTVADAIGCRGVWVFRCYDAKGRLRWQDTAENLVVNSGLDLVLGSGAGGDDKFVGLKLAGAVAPGDTMDPANPARAWAEFTGYSEVNRQGWITGAVVSQQLINTATPAAFSITATGAITGAFLTTSNTKGGITGTLIAAVDFTNGTKNVSNGDSLDVVYSLTATSS